MSSSVNSSSFSFTFTAFLDPGPLRVLWFLMLLLLYVTTVGSSLLLIVVIAVDRTLHQPMFLLLLSLMVNQLVGSAAIFPFLLLQMLQDEHSISHTFCFVQIFFLFSYGNVQILTLAAMAYDRFVAICFPLQYHNRLSSQKALKMVTGIWIFVLLEVGFMISLSAPLSLCGNQIHKVYCDNYSVVKLACGNTSMNNVYGLLYTCLVLLFVPALIIYSYARIIRVCLNGCKRTRHKALSTCAPHVASLLNVSLACFCELVTTRFDARSVPSGARVFMSLYFLTCPPLFDPLVYGLSMSKVRCSCRRLLFPERR
ncbi:olfactory receptor 11A1-like [Eucyclogobius newberryi]|uniref:olfactory receptor 11A1-like n=1 Tax=Eucyclogobius newberryi TaxID=166745 RepID=UPI003B5B06B2